MHYYNGYDHMQAGILDGPFLHFFKKKYIFSHQYLTLKLKAPNSEGTILVNFYDS